MADLADMPWCELAEAPAHGLRPGPDRVQVLRVVGEGDGPRDLVGAGLTPAEAGRAGRFREPADRRRFVLGRMALRAALAWSTGLAPAEIALAEGPQGKPRLAHSSAWVFNLSHSGQVVLLAWARTGTAGGSLGVDVERVRPVRDLAALARTALPDTARIALLGLPESERLPAFFTRWVVQEAVLKAQGTGLSGLSSLHRSGATVPPGWTLHRLHPLPDHPAAVAIAAPRAALQCWTATPSTLARRLGAPALSC